MNSYYAESKRNHDERNKTSSFVLHQVASTQGQGDCDQSSVRVFEEELACEQDWNRTSCERNAQELFSQHIIDIAKAHNLFIPNEEVKNLGEQILIRSGESVIYENTAQGLVYKVRDPFAKLHLKSSSLEDILYEHIAHNILFPEAKYTFIGVSESIDGLRIIYSQELFYNLNIPTQQQIDSHLASLRLYPNGYYYENEIIAITDVSAESDNVLVSDIGRLIFIDPIIKFKRSGKETIEILLSNRLDNTQQEHDPSLWKRIIGIFTRKGRR